jgi:hypothetical protein
VVVVVRVRVRVRDRLWQRSRFRHGDNLVPARVDE